MAAYQTVKAKVGHGARKTIPDFAESRKEKRKMENNKKDVMELTDEMMGKISGGAGQDGSENNEPVNPLDYIPDKKNTRKCEKRPGL